MIITFVFILFRARFRAAVGALVFRLLLALYHLCIIHHWQVVTDTLNFNLNHIVVLNFLHVILSISLFCCNNTRFLFVNLFIVPFDKMAREISPNVHVTFDVRNKIP